MQRLAFFFISERRNWFLLEEVRALPFFLLPLFSIQCATYWSNRKNDLQDIVTIGAEKPMYGAALQVGPVPVGVLFLGGETEPGKYEEGVGLGLRGGEFGLYRSQQLVYFFLGGASFLSGEPIRDNKGKQIRDKKGVLLSENERANIKSYTYRYFAFFNDPIKNRKKRKKESFKRQAAEDLVKETGKPEYYAYMPEADPKPFGYPAGTSWKVEATVGLYGGARVGVNFAELADFVLGILTYDLLEDDVEGKEAKAFPLPSQSESPNEE